MRNRGNSLEILIVSTFRGDAIGDVLGFLLRECGVDCKLRYAPVGQVIQELLLMTGAPSPDAPEIVVVLVRIEDLFGEGTGLGPCGNELSRRESPVSQLVVALEQVAATSPSTVVLCFCPSVRSEATSEAMGPTYASLEHDVISIVTKDKKLYVVSLADTLKSYEITRIYDPFRERLAGIPYTRQYTASLGVALARKIHAIVAPPFKAIFVDCDNTLWAGVCGEDGPHGVHIGIEQAELQRWLIEKCENGVLLCLCSKNNCEAVRQVFDLNPDMLLKREHFVAWAVDWHAKSRNIQKICRELGIATGSVVFIDDDPAECAQVASQCPDVLVLNIPAGFVDVKRLIRNVWACDGSTITPEDTTKTQFYLTNTLREDLRKQRLTFDEFIESLGLRVEIGRMSSADAPRTAQLSRRVNQFNVSGRQYSEAALLAYTNGSLWNCLTVRVTDRFGDYGLVGAVIFRLNSSSMIVDNLLLSCRALGRDVEYEVMARLGEIATEKGLNGIEFLSVDTGKNVPAMAFLRSLGSEHKSDAQETVFRITTSAATHASLSRGRERRENCWPSESVLLQDRAQVLAAPESVKRVEGLQRIVGWNHIDEIIEAVDDDLRQKSGLGSGSGYGSDADDLSHRSEVLSPMELRILSIWNALLGNRKISRTSDFFEVGGHSLLAVEMLVKIKEECGVEIAVETLFSSALTVGHLAEIVTELSLRQYETSDIDKAMAELRTMSEADMNALRDSDQSV
jgi:FkbH-like protein